MARILSAAVAILAVLWLVRDLYALESNQTSNDGDLYFDDSANKSNTPAMQPDASSAPFRRRGTYPSARSKAEDEDLKSKKGEIDQGKPDSSLKFPEKIDSLDVKQLLKYLLSLVYTLNESDENPSDELKYESNLNDTINQNKSDTSPVFSSQTNLTMISYTKYTDNRDVSEGDEREFEDFTNNNDGGDYDYEDENNKINQGSGNITTLNQAVHSNKTVAPLPQNSSNQADMQGKNPVDERNRWNIPPTTSRLFEEEFIDYYINRQPQYDQQKPNEKTNNASQPTINSKELNKTTDNQTPGDGEVSEQENKPLNFSLITFTDKNINSPAKIVNQNQYKRDNTVIEKQSTPQTLVYNVDTKEISHSPTQNSFLKVDNPLLPNKETEQNNELYRVPYQQDTIVQSPFQGSSDVNSPFQNVPGPYNSFNKPEPFNYQNTFNQKEPIYNSNPGTNPFTSKLNPSAQQVPSNVLPLQFSGYNYNQQYDKIPAVSKPRDQQNEFQQDVLPQNNPVSQYNLNKDTNVLQKSIVNNPPYLSNYKLKLPLHIRQIKKPLVSGSTLSDLPQDRNIFDDKFTNPVIKNEIPLYSPISNDRLVNPLNQEKYKPESSTNLLKQSTLVLPQNQIRSPPNYPTFVPENPTFTLENPTFATENPNTVSGNSVVQNQTGYLFIQNEFQQVTPAPPQNTTAVLIQSNNNESISEIQPGNTNISLPQNEYSNTEIEPPQGIFNNTGPLFQLQFNATSQQDDEIPSTNLENVTATTEQSITVLNNQSNIEPLSLTFYNFSQDLQSKDNYPSLDGNNSRELPVFNESKNVEESGFIENADDIEFDIDESKNEEESNGDESENEEESDADESENEEESDTGESEEDSETNDSENEESDEDEKSNDDEKSNEGEYEYEEEFNELLRVLGEMVNNATIVQSAENSSVTDMEYVTETPTNVTDISTQSENVESPKPEETFNTILEYILKFSNNPFFADMRQEQNVTTK